MQTMYQQVVVNKQVMYKQLVVKMLAMYMQAGREYTSDT